MELRKGGDGSVTEMLEDLATHELRVCAWSACEDTFEVLIGGPGRTKKYCCDYHRARATKDRFKARGLSYTKSRRERQAMHEEGFVDVWVEPRSLEEMRATGLTYFERQLLRMRRHEIQFPKEARWRRIEAQEGRYVRPEEATA